MESASPRLLRVSPFSRVALRRRTPKTLLATALVLAGLSLRSAAGANIKLVFTGELVLKQADFAKGGPLAVYAPRMEGARLSHDKKRWIPRHHSYVAIPTAAIMSSALNVQADCTPSLSLPGNTTPVAYSVFFVDGFGIKVKGVSLAKKLDRGKVLGHAMKLSEICSRRQFDTAVDDNKAENLSTYMFLDNAVLYTDVSSSCQWQFRPALEGSNDEPKAHLANRICVDGTSGDKVEIDLYPLSGKGKNMTIEINPTKDMEIDIGNVPVYGACNLSMDSFLSPDYHVELPYDLLSGSGDPDDIHLPWLVPGCVHVEHWLTGDCPPMLVEQ